MGIERLGFGDCPIGELDLRLHKGVKARAKTARIRKRAESIERLGPIYRPLVRKRDLLLVDGADRVAVAIAREQESLEVEWIECDDETAHHVRRHANAHRRHDPDEQAALLLEDLNQIQVEEMEKKPWLRPSRARGAARRKLAEVQGKRPENVGVNEARAKKRLKRKKPEPTDPPVRELGMELDAEWMKQAREARDLVMKAANCATQALRELGKLKNSELPYPSPKLQRLMGDVADMGAKLRGAVPYSLCPYCKGLDPLQESCTACAHSGLITKDQQDGIPARLWDEHYPVVAHDGIYKPAEDFFVDPLEELLG